VAKFLIETRYSAEGLRGLAKDKGSGRIQAVHQALQSLGGKLEAGYFAFGDRDFVAIIDLPNSVAAAALALAVGSSGSVSIQTTPLLTAEELDRALEAPVDYRAPGS
jgi:uncharacterized protein with GYD domain